MCRPVIKYATIENNTLIIINSQDQDLCIGLADISADFKNHSFEEVINITWFPDKITWPDIGIVINLEDIVRYFFPSFYYDWYC